jgi:hypothetical protein
MSDTPLKLDSFLTDVKVLKLAPDEILIVRIPEGMLEMADVVQMRNAVAKALGTDRVMVLTDSIDLEVVKVEQIEKVIEQVVGPLICEYCGGSGRDEGGQDCTWCKPWLPRKFA